MGISPIHILSPAIPVYTSGWSVSTVEITTHPIEYNKVNNKAIPKVHFNRADTVSRKFPFSLAPEYFPTSASALNANPSIKKEKNWNNCITITFTASVSAPSLAPAEATPRLTLIIHAERMKRLELTEKNFPRPPPLIISLSGHHSLLPVSYTHLTLPTKLEV